MAVKIDLKSCIGCGACESVADSIFEMKETKDGMKAIIKKQPSSDEEKAKAKEAQDGCPTDSISGA